MCIIVNIVSKNVFQKSPSHCIFADDILYRSIYTEYSTFRVPIYRKSIIMRIHFSGVRNARNENTNSIYTNMYSQLI